MRRALASLSRAPALWALFSCMVLVGCASNGERIDAIARASSLERSLIEVEGFRSVVYSKLAVTASETVLVFLEGDGRPWVDGVTPNLDPTTANPLALELMIRTPRPGIYVARPCYHNTATERCSASLWTSGRYSDDVVRVMTETVRVALRSFEHERIVLVGHSGGGVLAVLIAERLADVGGVVTIAANLDIDAWTSHHGYLPLWASLNPARSTQPHPWPEIHLAGRTDIAVPIETTSSYFARYSSAKRWILEEDGHVCCWKEKWPELWERVERELKVRRDE